MYEGGAVIFIAHKNVLTYIPNINFKAIQCYMLCADTYNVIPTFIMLSTEVEFMMRKYIHSSGNYRHLLTA